MCTFKHKTGSQFFYILIFGGSVLLDNIQHKMCILMCISNLYSNINNKNWIATFTIPVLPLWRLFVEAAQLDL